MKEYTKKANVYARTSLSMITTVLVMVLVMFSSCRHKSLTKDINTLKAATDSTLATIDDTLQLKQMAEDYAKSGNIIGEMMTYKRLGKIYYDNLQYLTAIDFNERGYALAESLADTISMTQTLNSIGTNFRRMGIMDEAANYHYRALALANAYSDTSTYDARKNRVVSLNGIGNICLTLGDRQTADSVFRMALAGEAALGSDLGQAINYANLGSIFEGKGENDSALFYYKKSLKHNQIIKSDVGIALCYNHFGDLYEKTGLYEKAIEQYKRSYNIMERNPDRWHWMESCLALARVYEKTGRDAEAKQLLAKAHDEATKLNSLEHLASIYRFYHIIYNKEKRWYDALHYNVKAQAYADSVQGEKNLVHMQNVRVKYEHDRRQAEIDTLRHSYDMEKKMRHMSIIAVIAVTVMAIVVVAFLWYALRMRKHKQKLLMKNEKAMLQFFTNITHEFRTPLTVILGHSKRMATGQLKETETVTVGQAITRQGQRLLQLINQILDISRISSGVDTPEWKSGDIVVYIGQLLDSFSVVAAQKNIEIVFAPKQQHAEADFVADFMQKIVCNLMSNAIKFSLADSNILVTLNIEDNEMTLRIADFGKGMTEEEQSHIFDLFYQSSSAKGEIGSGVGLALVKQIVNRLHGHIAVESSKGVGSVFTLLLPTKASSEKGRHTQATVENQNNETQDIAIASEDLPQSTATVDTGDDAIDDGRPTVLIVEDNIDVAEYIQLGLGDKYILRFARNGEEGLQKAAELVPDIIVTDLMMPVMDGLQMTERLRQSDVLNHIPIIMVTAKSTDADRLQGLQTGADAYLPKPFSTDELSIRIDRLLERQRMMREKYSLAIEQKAEQPEDNLDAKGREFLERLTQVIETTMGSGSISVETVASAMCMSSQQLRRKLSTITGETPAFYIRRVQMMAARRLMTEDASMPISEVAYHCGYYDVSHFGRVFKQIFGETPSQARSNISRSTSTKRDHC